jgi:hypothetical protein
LCIGGYRDPVQAHADEDDLLPPVPKLRLRRAEVLHHLQAANWSKPGQTPSDRRPNVNIIKE